MNDIINLYDHNLVLSTSWQYLNHIPATANHICVNHEHLLFDFHSVQFYVVTERIM